MAGAEMGQPSLVRAVGLLSLTAMAVNGIIGAGIFVLPAVVARLAGPAGWFAYVAAGSAIFLVVLCFAEAGSRFETSGGPFVYARAAFGGFTGFLAGWMFLLSRLAGFAAVSNGLAGYAGHFWPPAAAGLGRLSTITLLFALLTFVNTVGLRQSVWVMNLLTLAKLLPLAVFVIFGLIALDPHRYAVSAAFQVADLREAALVLVFAFGGFEYASIPGEEVVNPRRNLPIALIVATAVVSVCYLLIHLVAQGALPDLAASEAPLAAAAKVLFGPAGAGLMTLGAILSMAGTNSSSMLAASRMVYALGKEGPLPAILARVHPRYRTPWIAVWAFALLSWVFAISGTFEYLAVISSLGRLFFYGATCAAVLVLRRNPPDGRRYFAVPGGPVVPLLAIAMCIWLLTGVPASQVKAGMAALLIGALLYGVSRLPTA
jgi:amino acid transporter